MTLSVLCPHCGAHDLIHAAWQSICHNCGKWSGVEPAQVVELPFGASRAAQVETTTVDGGLPATPSSLISGARPSLPPEAAAVEPDPVSADPEAVVVDAEPEPVVVAEPTLPPAPPVDPPAETVAAE